MSLARMSRATLLAAFLGALLLATPVTARRSLFEVAHDHDEHERVKAMDDALKRFDSKEAGFSIHDVDLTWCQRDCREWHSSM